MREARDGQVVLQELLQAGKKTDKIRADGPAKLNFRRQAARQNMVTFYPRCNTVKPAGVSEPGLRSRA